MRKEERKRGRCRAARAGMRNNKVVDGAPVCMVVPHAKAQMIMCYN